MTISVDRKMDNVTNLKLEKMTKLPICVPEDEFEVDKTFLGMKLS